MARQVETQMTISCLQCHWSVEAAHAHADQHEQHAIEVVQRLRLYSENYVEPTLPSQDTRDAATGGDIGIQTGFLDRTRRLDH